MTGPEIVEFKRIGNVSLNVHIFRPDDWSESDKRSAIVYFHCGGWGGHDPRKHYPSNEYLASRGMVGFNAEVRVVPVHKTTAVECVIDGKSAIRWVRRNAARLGVDPDRIAASGSSAAGHVSAATSAVPDCDDPADDLSVSCAPNAAILLCPALDIACKEKRIKIAGGLENAKKISPMEHVHPGLPPTLILQAKDDMTCKVTEATGFADKMRAAGNRCDLVLYEKGGHGCFNFWDGRNPLFTECMRETDWFLNSLGWIKGTPTIDGFEEKLGLAEEWLKNKGRSE